MCARARALVAARLRSARERQAQGAAARHAPLHRAAHRALLLATPVQLDRASDRAARVHRLPGHSAGAQLALRIQQAVHIYQPAGVGQEAGAHSASPLLGRGRRSFNTTPVVLSLF